jgi:hypothetical protein
MPHLLTLPRELRDMIIDFVLASPSKRPCDSPQNDEQPRTDWDEYTQIPTERSAYRTTSFGLLTANMQLSCETRQRIESMRCKPVHQLDVMVVNGKEFLPTWINVPSLKSTRIEELQVTFRIFGTPEHLSLAPGSTGDFNHELAWSLYYLLWAFLRRGPTMRF